jgi:excisionase family DNA binding protein
MISDDELAEHFAKALLWYFRHERTNGRHVPIEVLDVAKYILEGSMRQDATNDGLARRSAHAERMDNELLTKTRAAKELLVSVRTVERLIGAGELVAIRSGRSVRIRRADLATYINQRRATFLDALERKEGGAA